MTNHIFDLQYGQHGFVAEECGCLNLPAVQTFHWLKTPRASQNKKHDESFIRQEWVSIPLTAFLLSDSWSSQFPDVYRVLLKEEMMPHSGKHNPCPNFSETCCSHQTKNDLIEHPNFVGIGVVILGG